MAALNHLRFANVNRKWLPLRDTIGDMDSRPLLARNLAAMMAKSPDLGTQGALHRRSRVAQATIGRILRGETGATLETLDQLAGAFGLSAWQLIHPQPDIPAGEAIFYAKLRKILDDASDKH